jgi:hypothetical protein
MIPRVKRFKNLTALPFLSYLIFQNFFINFETISEKNASKMDKKVETECLIIFNESFSVYQCHLYM